MVEGEIELAGHAAEGVRYVSETERPISAVVPLARGVDDGVALVDAPSIFRLAGRPVRVRGGGERVLPEPGLVRRGGARVAPRLRQAQPARIAAGYPRQLVFRHAVDGRDRGPDLRAAGLGLRVGKVLGHADERGGGDAVRAGQGVKEERHYSSGAHRRRPRGGCPWRWEATQD